MLPSSPAVTISVRVSPERREQLEQLSQATGRTKSYLAAQAINDYLASQAWQIKAIQEGLEAADQPNAAFVTHDEVSTWLQSWGTKNEQDAPEWT